MLDEPILGPTHSSQNPSHDLESLQARHSAQNDPLS